MIISMKSVLLIIPDRQIMGMDMGMNRWIIGMWMRIVLRIKGSLDPITVLKIWTIRNLV